MTKRIVFNGSKAIYFGEGGVPGDGYRLIKVKKKKEIAGIVERFMDPDDTKDLVIKAKRPDKLFRRFKKHFKYVKAAGGLVRNPEGEYLFIKRLDKWDLPKGGLKKGESPRKGARREVMEETGVSNLKIEQHLPNSWHVYVISGKKHLKKIYWYLMKVAEKQELTPQTDEDITEAVWFGPEQSRNALKSSYRSLHEILSPFIR